MNRRHIFVMTASLASSVIVQATAVAEQTVLLSVPTDNRSQPFALAEENKDENAVLRQQLLQTKAELEASAKREQCLEHLAHAQERRAILAEQVHDLSMKTLAEVTASRNGWRVLAGWGIVTAMASWASLGALIYLKSSARGRK